MTSATRPPVGAATNPDGMGQVQLADQVVAVTALREHPERFTHLFVRARHEIGHAVCLCQPDRPRLVIRCRSGRYHLATWPGGSAQHTPACPWHRHHPALSGRGAYTQAITTMTDGRTMIRLSTPLVVRGAAGTPTTLASAHSDTTVSGSRQSAGLLSMVHFLWEAALLNVWQPGSERRTWPVCRALLAEQASRCRINRLPMSDTLWIVRPYQPELAEQAHAAWEQFLAHLTSTGRTRHRGLVLGELRDVDTTTYGVRLRLRHQRGALFATTPLLDRATRSYPSVFSAEATQPGRRRVALCLIERSPRGWPVIVDLAAMLTTSTYLPVESSLEARMADALVAAGRTFTKPLRHSRDDAVFPDFVLTDGEQETYVEVWGVRGRESYETRRRAKQAFYRDSGRTLLEWDVRDPLPAIDGGCAPG